MMKMKKCPLCDGKTLFKKVPFYTIDGLYLGDFDADLCVDCHEVFFTEESSKRITESAIKHHVWRRDIETLEEGGNTKESISTDYISCYYEPTLKRYPTLSSVVG